LNKTQSHYKKGKTFIPGGTQLLSKRPELFLPGYWPSYYSRAKGCEVWDLDGAHYIDMSSMGVGACIIGYGDDDINEEVKKAVDAGNMSSLNAPEEVDLAELLCNIHPWAEMVRFARTGGEAMAIAIRIARAKSGKDIVLFSGYHGWHDWYLAANLADEKSLDGHLLPGLNPSGVPRALKGTSFPFIYNDTKGFLELVEQNKKRIGAIVIESIRNVFPDKEFIDTIHRVKNELDIALVVDEISAGWRMNVGGAHLVLGIKPDIAVFAKGMSNGFPMAAIIGKRDFMESSQDTFISSTYWTDRIGPVAAIASIKKMQRHNIAEHLKAIGKKIQEGWVAAAARNGINISVSGIYPLSHFVFNHENPLVLKTIFTHMMLERGYLASTSFYASYAHKSNHIDNYMSTIDDVFKLLGKYINDGNVMMHLKGEACHSGFKRLT